MTRRENVLKTIRFERPDHIPIEFHINPACWHHYNPDELQDLMEDHAVLFPNFSRQVTVTPTFAPNQLADHPFTDPWGCVWETSDDGITGSVRQHPLTSWDMINNYNPPDPNFTNGMSTIDWRQMAASVAKWKVDGQFIVGGLTHGHTFLRLIDILGYENLLYSMNDETPALARLISMVAEFNMQIVTKWLAMEPDMMSYPEDLGMQLGPMISPEYFRTWIKPVYASLMKPARKQGCIVHMHSDGDIRTLVDDLIDGGVDVINLQDLVNGIDWIADKFAGTTCIDLDIDRQNVTAMGTPDQIDDLIRQEVETLGSKEGGLMMIYGLYPGVPMENIRALMDAMERYSGFYS